MEYISIIILAIGLSLDSFAVSVSNGFAFNKIKIKQKLRIAFYLSFFQMIMPPLGWLAGKGMQQFVMQLDHWIAFSLLFLIGMKMIYEGLATKKQDGSTNLELTMLVLIGQSIATSIDALVVGISFAFISVDIIMPSLIIGITTFIFSMSGLYLGKYYGNKLGSKLEIGAGILLITISFKILFEHLSEHGAFLDFF